MAVGMMIFETRNLRFLRQFTASALTAAERTTNGVDVYSVTLSSRATYQPRVTAGANMRSARVTNTFLLDQSYKTTVTLRPKPR